MVTEVNAAEFEQTFDEMPSRVQHRNDSIVISKDGKPVAAPVDAEAFARIQRMWSRFDELTARIAEGFAGIPEEEGMAEIDRIVYEVRHGHNG